MSCDLNETLLIYLNYVQCEIDFIGNYFKSSREQPLGQADRGLDVKLNDKEKLKKKNSRWQPLGETGCALNDTLPINMEYVM